MVCQENGLSALSGFPRCSSAPPEKGEKVRKRAKKSGKGRFSGRQARLPLNPHLLHSDSQQPNLWPSEMWRT